MDSGRFSDALGAEQQAAHMRIAEYVRAICDRYPAVGFTRHQEWVAEQTMHALQTLLTHVHCTDDERRAIEEFLALASEQLSGPP